MTTIEKLLSVGSKSLCSRPKTTPELLRQYRLGPELFQMLELKNGFYAFESALHVFPIGCGPPLPDFDLQSWNSESLWRGAYQDLTTGLLFFAEDVFQDQFCLAEQGVLRFNAETGKTVVLAESVEKWAGLILLNHRDETAWALARQWQSEHHQLQRGKRLMPRVPFFLGGQYKLENLWVGDAVAGMRFKAELAIQTRSLPEGSKVKLHVGSQPGNPGTDTT